MNDKVCYQGADFAINIMVSVTEDSYEIGLRFPETKLTIEYGYLDEFLNRQHLRVKALEESVINDINKCFDQGIFDCIDQGENLILEINVVDWDSIQLEQTIWNYISEESLAKAMDLVQCYFGL